MLTLGHAIAPQINLTIVNQIDHRVNFHPHHHHYHQTLLVDTDSTHHPQVIDSPSAQVYFAYEPPNTSLRAASTVDQQLIFRHWYSSYLLLAIGEWKMLPKL